MAIDAGKSGAGAHDVSVKQGTSRLQEEVRGGAQVPAYSRCPGLTIYKAETGEWKVEWESLPAPSELKALQRAIAVSYGRAFRLSRRKEKYNV